jgi:signal transduction histidine kinase
VLRRIPILAKLLGAYLVPTAATFAGFGALAHYLAARSLEDELSRRLTSVAAAAASAISDENVAFLQPGDESTRIYRAVRKRLDQLKAATGVDRIYVIDADGTSRCDTRPGVPIGERYYTLLADRAEVRAAFRGETASSLLFRGVDGVQYKSGFAPLADESGAVHFAVGVDGAASMYEQLARFRRALVVAGLTSALGVIVLSVLVARVLVRPIRRLEAAATRIAEGQLTEPVGATSRDEIGVVAEAMEGMRVQLRNRDERMQMMLAGIAHEVRNPLGGLALYAGILRDDLADSPEKLEHARRIEREVEQLKGIVGDFLEYARRQRPLLQPVDLAELLDEVRQHCAPDAAPRGVEVVVEAAPLKVAGDRGQLRRALLNLAQNAVQACPPGADGRVALRCARENGAVAVTISDNGPGIAEDALAKIWTPFYTTKQKGTGLGLAFVRDIADDHGARIDVTSALGRGTTFKLVLKESA